MYRDPPHIVGSRVRLRAPAGTVCGLRWDVVELCMVQSATRSYFGSRARRWTGPNADARTWGMAPANSSFLSLFLRLRFGFARATANAPAAAPAKSPGTLSGPIRTQPGAVTHDFFLRHSLPFSPLASRAYTPSHNLHAHPLLQPATRPTLGLTWRLPSRLHSPMTPTCIRVWVHVGCGPCFDSVFHTAADPSDPAGRQGLEVRLPALHERLIATIP